MYQFSRSIYRELVPRIDTCGGSSERTLAARRQILELFATERALASEAWLRDETGLRVHVEREGKLNELAGSRDPELMERVLVRYLGE